MRNHLINELTRLAESDERICVLTGDLGFHVLDKFQAKFPHRYVNAGIAEQNMLSVAAGMAIEGNVVCVYSIGNFPTFRCLEQIRNAACYHNANVKIISTGCGFVYGQLGMTHHATEDIAVMRALPGMRIFSPADPDEAVAVMDAAVAMDGPCYIRLGRGGEPRYHPYLKKFGISQPIELRRGKDLAIFSTGSILGEALAAADTSKVHGVDVGVYNCVMLKPFDSTGFLDIARNYKMVFSLEEHNVVGGLGGILAEALATADGDKPRLVRCGLQDVFTTVVGTAAYLRDHYGLSAKALESTLAENVPIARDGGS